MRRIAVINQKGGVGKTTTTANLGAALARAGWRVLLIDLDPQSHLTLHLGAEVADGQFSIYDVLTAATPIARAARRVGDHMTIVPADIDLAGADTELISVTGREVILREALEALEDEYDVLLIDCPPALGVLTINALAAVFEVVIPLQAHFFALQGLGKLLDTITLVRQRINAALRVGGVVLCMHESATRLASEVVEDLRAFLAAARDKPVAWAGARIYPTSIRRNIKLAESPSYGQSVFDYAPRSNGALDYARLAEEMFGVDANLILPGIGTFDRAPEQPAMPSRLPPPRHNDPPLNRETPHLDQKSPHANQEVSHPNREIPPPQQGVPQQSSPQRIPLTEPTGPVPGSQVVVTDPTGHGR